MTEYLASVAPAPAPAALNSNAEGRRSWTDGANVPTPLQQLPNAGFFQIVFTIGCLELWSETVKPHYTAGGTPGGLIPGFYMPTKAASLEAQNKELKNGRLAMIGIMSFFAAEAIPGSVPGYPW